MYTTKPPLKQLEQIYDLLEHPAIDNYSVYYKVRAALRNANYQNPRPALHLGGCFRASGLSQTESHTPALDRLSYPAPLYARLGRCNWHGEPMFYCSNQTGVPVYEIRAKKDTIFAMSKWVRQDCDTLSTQGYEIEISPSLVGIDRIIQTLGDNPSIKDYLTEYKNSMPLEIQEIDAFIGELFAKPFGSVPNLYWFTSAIARFVLNDLYIPFDGLGLDGLMYPSVQSQFTGFNLAIKPSFVTKHLKLQGSVVYQISEYDESTYSYLIRALRSVQGKVTAGQMNWANIHPEDAHKRLRLSPKQQVVYTKIPPTLRYGDGA